MVMDKLIVIDICDGVIENVYCTSGEHTVVLHDLRQDVYKGNGLFAPFYMDLFKSDDIDESSPMVEDIKIQLG